MAGLALGGLLFTALFIREAPALRIGEAAAQRTGWIPGEVSGPRLLDREEMEGQKPLFVDAFLDANETGAYIILNWFLSKDKTNWNWEPNELRWHCAWAAPADGSVLYGSAPIEVEGSVVHYSAPENDALEAWRDGDDSNNDTTHGAQITWTRQNVHSSLVVGCPLPPAVSNLSLLELGFSASAAGERVYHRTVPVRRKTFIEKDALVLCTMVNDINGTHADLLWPWAKFHRVMGFEQILMYVEEESMDDAVTALRGLVEKGEVTLVPFFFGNISRRRAFRLQASMMHDCNFRTKGHASWTAMNDVDELFEFRDGLRLRDFLDQMPQDTAVVKASMQFHQLSPGPPLPRPRRQSDMSIPVNQSVPFPCYVNCKVPVSWTSAHLPKCISRPERVIIHDPHGFITQNGKTVEADTSMLRLAHYRHCRPGGCFDTNPSRVTECEPDEVFTNTCTAALAMK